MDESLITRTRHKELTVEINYNIFLMFLKYSFNTNLSITPSTSTYFRQCKSTLIINLTEHEYVGVYLIVRIEQTFKLIYNRRRQYNVQVNWRLRQKLFTLEECHFNYYCFQSNNSPFFVFLKDILISFHKHH